MNCALTLPILASACYVTLNASSQECNRLHNMLTDTYCEVSPGPLYDYTCGPGYEAV